MKIEPASIEGAFIIQPSPVTDTRGQFVRLYDQGIFANAGLCTEISQSSVSTNIKKGTLRGIHWQAAPYEETKFVSCISGAIYDVLVDLRPESSTYKAWMALELTESNRCVLYVPAGVGHGFMTLTDNAHVFYQIGGVYTPEAARGCRWNDPAFCIQWPSTPTLMSQRDQTYADFVGQ